MPSFTTTLQKFDEKGEKTGWTYIDIPLDVTESLRPGQKTSFRVKGSLDDYALAQVALLPMGKSGDREGGFIMPINATMRRGIRKEAGATVQVTLAVDDSPMPLSADLLACLDDDPPAKAFFQTLARGHQVYFSNWIEEAKTIETKTRRLTQAVMGLSMGLGFGPMIRHFKNKP
ncbi:DUF1905 domain-containing protein [Spirosoma aerophilum]